ncbi:hypothetical protein BGW41_007813 [Actinomortierella wolfii]|nr:hypothetical protein BGW41_007813 [Actinomortierella wolfii]
MHFKTLFVAATAAIVAVTATEEIQAVTDNIQNAEDLSIDASKIMWNPYYSGHWGSWGRYPWRRRPIYYKRAGDETANSKNSVTDTLDDEALLSDELIDAEELDASKWGYWPYYRRRWGWGGFYHPWGFHRRWYGRRWF